MPTYEYVCPAGHEFEKFQKMSDKPRAACPTCGKPGTRKISGGAGLVFKGSGFYITDYGKDGKGPRKAGDSEKPAASGSSGEAKSESKSEPKTDTKAKADKPAPKKAVE